jgi:hypothetical protein
MLLQVVDAASVLKFPNRQLLSQLSKPMLHSKLPETDWRCVAMTAHSWKRSALVGVIAGGLFAPGEKTVWKKRGLGQALQFLKADRLADRRCCWVFVVS